MSINDGNRASIVSAGAVVPIVGLIRSSATTLTQDATAVALAHLSTIEAGRTAIASAGGIRRLTWLVASSPSRVARAAAGAALDRIRRNDA